MAGEILNYARPGTTNPPIAFPAVFPENQRSVAMFSVIAGVIAGIPALFLHPMFGIAMLASAALSAAGLVRRRGDYLVLDVDALQLRGVTFRRSDVISCSRGWNGFRLRLRDGRSIIRISLLEIRRKDVARLEQALEEYFGHKFDRANHA